MDLSKLPKLSQTPPPPNGGGEEVAAAGATPAVELFCRCGAPVVGGLKFCAHCGASYQEVVGGRGSPRRAVAAVDAGGMWVEALFSVAVAVFLLMMAPGAVKYFGHAWFGINTGPFVDPITNQPADYVLYMDGSRRLYRDLINYWSDLAIAAFAVALIVEGVVLAFVRKRWVVLGAGLLTAAATLGNFAFVVGTYSTYGLQLLQATAVVMGVVMAGYLFKTFAELTRG